MLAGPAFMQQHTRCLLLRGVHACLHAQVVWQACLLLLATNVSTAFFAGCGDLRS